MLIRRTESSHECLPQRQHALLSGVLAGAWTPSRLDPLLVEVVGLHDDPWSVADRSPLLNAGTGRPHDFLTYPTDRKLDFYRRGLDDLERVHPWAAYLVSRHYTTFSGTRELSNFQQSEQRRRDRLEGEIPDDLLDRADAAVDWIKFFDIFSLHLCLTGPAARPESIPRWLTDSDAWSTAPDGTALTLEWGDDSTLCVEPWPFRGESLVFGLHPRKLDDEFDDDGELRSWWGDAPRDRRTLALVPGPKTTRQTD